MKLLVPAIIGLVCVVSSSVYAQSDPPELSSWLRNTSGVTGYGGLPANVQQVRYSDNYVYVSASGVPAYAIGPWGHDPNVPTNQGSTFKIARHPVGATTFTATGLGPIAILTNGVAAFNAKDANSYNNRNVWHSNAVVVEGADMDGCLGHPAPGGTYHHHQNPRCLYNADSTKHSAIIGFAFDGYPIYGAYGFAHADGSGGITRIRSSFRARSMTQRTSLADGTILTAAQYGPDVSSTYPLGYYSEDFEYVANLGDLDEHNGRFAVTPEYPQGTYAYYGTVDANGASAFPYLIGTTYAGVVVQENITQRGKVTVGETVKTYTGSTAVADDQHAVPTAAMLGAVAPDPVVAGVDRALTVQLGVPEHATVSFSIVNMLGQERVAQESAGYEAGTHGVSIDCSSLQPGAYAIVMHAAGTVRTAWFMVTK